MAANGSWQIGLVVHPSRDIGEPLGAVLAWANAHDARVVQIPIFGQPREVAPGGEAGDCRVIVSIGGDGTTLAAIRVGADSGTPVLGVTCGSLGALTTVDQRQVTAALDRFAAGDWQPQRLPALRIERDGEPPLQAINDVVVVRDGQGQLRTDAYLDGELFGRMAGDGCIVSTQAGSSAYALAAGGPLLVSGIDAFLLTALPTHGGSLPPLVIPAGSELRLITRTGHGKVRLELDGQPQGAHAGTITVHLQPDVATLVCLPGQEPLLAGLRRRGILTDSPRILADDRSAAAEGEVTGAERGQRGDKQQPGWRPEPDG